MNTSSQHVKEIRVTQRTITDLAKTFSRMLYSGGNKSKSCTIGYASVEEGVITACDYLPSLFKPTTRAVEANGNLLVIYLVDEKDHPVVFAHNVVGQMVHITEDQVIIPHYGGKAWVYSIQ